MKLKNNINSNIELKSIGLKVFVTGKLNSDTLKDIPFSDIDLNTLTGEERVTMYDMFSSTIEDFKERLFRGK